MERVRELELAGDHGSRLDSARGDQVTEGALEPLVERRLGAPGHRGGEHSRLQGPWERLRCHVFVRTLSSATVSRSSSTLPERGPAWQALKAAVVEHGITCQTETLISEAGRAGLDWEGISTAVSEALAARESPPMTDEDAGHPRTVVPWRL